MSYEYDKDGSSAEESDEEYEEGGPSFVNSYVLIAIDCSQSMFNSDTPDFHKAIKAVCKSAENLIFNKTCYRRMAVILHHPDENQRIIMDFKNDHFADSLLKLQKLANTTSESLYTDYCYNNNTFHLGNFLIECKKLLSKVGKNDKKYLFYITNNGDPSGGDKSVMFQVQQEVSEMEDIQIDLQILPTQQSFDYDTFYGDIMPTQQKHFYNQQHLTIKIDGAIKVKPFNKKIQLHLNADPDSKSVINCLENKYCKLAKLLPNIHLTKDFKSEVFSVASIVKPSTYILPIKNKSGPNLSVNSEFKECLYDCADVKVGLCVTHAARERYSQPGMFYKTASLIKAHEDSAEIFTAFWTSCKNNNYYVLCTYKNKQHGKMYPAELTPVLLEGECYFKMIVMPQVNNIYAPELAIVKVEKNDDEKLDVLLNSLLEDIRIADYDMTNMLPYKYTKQMQYFHKEMFGSKYVYTGKTADYLDTKHLSELAQTKGSSLFNLIALYPPPELAAEGASKRKRQPRKK